MKTKIDATWFTVDLPGAGRPGEPLDWDVLLLEIPAIARTLVLRREAGVDGEPGEVTCEVVGRAPVAPASSDPPAAGTVAIASPGDPTIVNCTFQ